MFQATQHHIQNKQYNHKWLVFQATQHSVTSVFEFSFHETEFFVHPVTND